MVNRGPLLATATTALVMIASVATITLSAGCGKKEQAKSAEQVQADKDATSKAVRSNALTATPMAGYDKAKDVQKTMDKQAEDANKKIEGDTK